MKIKLEDIIIVSKTGHKMPLVEYIDSIIDDSEIHSAAFLITGDMDSFNLSKASGGSFKVMKDILENGVEIKKDTKIK